MEQLRYQEHWSGLSAALEHSTATVSSKGGTQQFFESNAVQMLNMMDVSPGSCCSCPSGVQQQGTCLYTCVQVPGCSMADSSSHVWVARITVMNGGILLGCDVTCS